MTRDELKHYRTELLKLAASLSEELAVDRRELRREDRADDDRTDAGVQEVQVGLIATEEQLLDQVVAALDRIDAGKFGVCEECGRKIARARLDAVPYAPNCVCCAGVTRPVAG